MNIKQHKALIAQIPEDLVEGEDIEVSSDGIEWVKRVFVKHDTSRECSCLQVVAGKTLETWWDWFPYARRPAPSLKDEPWPIYKSLRYRAVDADGRAGYYFCEPYLCGDKWSSGNGWFDENDISGPIKGKLFGTTDWQNSLEERPADHSADASKMVPLDGCITGDEVMVSKKKYRPWRLGDKIPAPLMVRRKSIMWDGWVYACPFGVNDGQIMFYLMRGDRTEVLSSDLFKHYEQHDGIPCGVEEAT